MKNEFKLINIVLSLLFFSVMANVAFAAEAVVVKEEVPTTIITKQLAKTADNFIVMFDSSSSMKEPFLDTGMTALAAAKKMLKDRNEILPEMGYTAGLYLYTPFTPVYEMQKYDREKFAAALEQLPGKASGPTLLQQGLIKLDGLLSGLNGKTVVYLFTDGTFTDMSLESPLDLAKGLAEKYNVCFYVISSASGNKQVALLKSVASINACSRVLSFEQMYENPTYMTGGLFVIQTNVMEYLATYNRVVDFKVDNILFGFDSAEIGYDYEDELDSLGKFLSDNPKTYVLLAGFTDNIGDAEYNLGLARKRAESVGAYLTDKWSVSANRIITQWYGKDHPLSKNDTKYARHISRRVESIVLGID